MAKDKKVIWEKRMGDEEEKGKDFAVIPMKFITPIMIILIVIGTIGKMIAPNFTASLGPMIVDPFASILWAYGAIIGLMTLMGDKKTGMQIMGSITPMIVLALVIPTIFGSGLEYVIAPIMFMVLFPFVMKAIQDRFLKPQGLTFGEEEEHESEFDAAKIKEYGADIKQNIETVKSNARKASSLIPRDTLRDIGNFYGEAHDFGHKLMQSDEKKLKKARLFL